MKEFRRLPELQSVVFSSLPDGATDDFFRTDRDFVAEET
jgi:hypothetical protein